MFLKSFWLEADAPTLRCHLAPPQEQCQPQRQKVRTIMKCTCHKTVTSLTFTPNGPMSSLEHLVFWFSKLSLMASFHGGGRDCWGENMSGFTQNWMLHPPALTCQSKCPHWCNNVKTVYGGNQPLSLLDLRPVLQEGIQTRYNKHRLPVRA